MVATRGILDLVEWRGPMYTSHGHHMPGTVEDPRMQPRRVECGGINVCPQCSAEASPLRSRTADSVKSPDNPLDVVSPVTKARMLVFGYVKAQLEKTDTHVTFEEGEVYVVWFCKTLQNWKALVSTTLPDGMYYEVTYNGDKRETYIDSYKKFHNVKIPD